MTDPEITPSGGDTISISGGVTDDGSMTGMTVQIGGVASGSGTVNPDGTFSIDLPTPTQSGTITITITDADGNSTTMDIEYTV